MRLIRHDAAGGRGLLLLLGLITCALALSELQGCTSAMLPATLRQERHQHQRRTHQVRKHRVKQRSLPLPYPTWRTK